VSIPILNNLPSRRTLRPRSFIRLLLVFALGLMAGRAIGDEYLSGTVRDTLWLHLAPYRVVGNVIVPEGETLVINPGVQVIFEGNFLFEVRGRLNAVGGVDPAARIRFERGIIPQWRGITFQPEADARSSLVNCDISGAWIGVDINRAFLSISGCSIEARSVGINCIGAAPEIRDNLLIRAVGTMSDAEVRAISLRSSSSPQIIGNRLIMAESMLGGEAYGIFISESYPRIYGNWIEVVSITDAAIGVYAVLTSKTDLVRNVVRVSSAQAMRCVWTRDASGIHIVSNTMHMTMSSTNAVGVLVDRRSEVSIVNNILIGNGFSVGDSTVYGTVLRESGWNNYWLHDENHVGDWDGGEGEISADPLFVRYDPDREFADYHLTWRDFPREDRRSPCIDAGTPGLVDPGDEFNTRSDIGAFPFIYDPGRLSLSYVEMPPDSPGLISAFPNPFNNNVIVTVVLALPGSVKATLIDSQGRKLKVLEERRLDAGSNQIGWRPDGMAAGLYWVRVEVEGRSLRSLPLIYLP